MHDLPLDQALLNLIVHRQLSQPELVPNLASVSTRLELQGDGGSMNTVGSVMPVPMASAAGAGGHQVAESDGATPSVVVHQFDRHPSLWLLANRLGGVSEADGALELMHEVRGIAIEELKSKLIMEETRIKARTREMHVPSHFLAPSAPVALVVTALLVAALCAMRKSVANR